MLPAYLSLSLAISFQFIFIFNILYTLFNLNGCLISVFHPQRSY